MENDMDLSGFGFRSYYLSFVLLLLAVMVFSAATGALDLSLGEIWTYLADRLGLYHDPGIVPLRENIFYEIRLPRVILCAPEPSAKAIVVPEPAAPGAATQLPTVECALAASIAPRRVQVPAEPIGSAVLFTVITMSVA